MHPLFLQPHPTEVDQAEQELQSLCEELAGKVSGSGPTSLLPGQGGSWAAGDSDCSPWAAAARLAEGLEEIEMQVCRKWFWQFLVETALWAQPWPRELVTWLSRGRSEVELPSLAGAVQ